MRIEDDGERGVYESPHRSMNDRPWVYAANRVGRMIKYLEFGADTGRTREQAIARLWDTLDRDDPLRPFPAPAFLRGLPRFRQLDDRRWLRIATLDD